MKKQAQLMKSTKNFQEKNSVDLKCNYTPCNYFLNNINDILDETLTTVKQTKNKKQIEYINSPAVFDIETTSFYSDNEKQATMYAFVFGINGKCILGRTWKEFINILIKVQEFYNLSTSKRLIVWVHNLSYEFQFIRKLFNWEKIFSLEERKPVQCVSTLGIEFRCSYILSGYSLAKVGENLLKYKASKMIGDLDYDLPRHSKTVLTEKEKGYILNDGIVVMNYIQETIENDGNITKLPLTKTGYVRNYCRSMCYYDGNKSHKNNNGLYKRYRSLMNALTLTSVTEYEQLKRAFQGGFTHSNAFYNNIICEDVTSYDFTSSYPAQMVAKHYPMSRGRIIDIKSKEEFEYYLKHGCCVFDIQFNNIESTFLSDNYISISKCFEKVKPVINNGRVVSAELLITTITNIDFDIIKRVYKWESITVNNFRFYESNYLPTQLVKSILKLYNDKTTLKGVEGKEIEYLHSKEQLNSCYGMCVTDICRDDILYDECELNEWNTEKVDYEKVIQQYNESKSRFLFYPWGIFVTAYARQALWCGILNAGNSKNGDDFIYSDTDSIKILNGDSHLSFINNYNTYICNELEKALKYHKLDVSLYKPKTIKGIEKPLGVWDFDGHYKRFKTLGAKRYCYQYDDGTYSLTVSGINKKTAIPYLLMKGEPLELFDDGLEVPATYTNKDGEKCMGAGKNIHTYIDYECKGVLKDYNGIYNKYYEKSCVHMEPTGYNMSLSLEYLDYILGIKEIK